MESHRQTVDQARLRVPKVWRSEIGLLCLFVVSCVGSVALSRALPITVVTGEVLRIGGYRLVLGLPLLWFVPAGVLGTVMYRIYDVRYSLDARAIEACVGILSLNQRVTRVRYEDVRSVETDQTFVERLLDVGRVEVSTAASGGVEVEFIGVAAPFEVRDLIERERDRRQKLARKLAVHKEQSSREEHGTRREQDADEVRGGIAR